MGGGGWEGANIKLAKAEDQKTLKIHKLWTFFFQTEQTNVQIFRDKLLTREKRTEELLFFTETVKKI